MPKISALPPLTSPVSDDEMPIVDDSTSTTKKFTISQITPPGIIFPYAGSAAPDGFLLCDGSAVSRTTYAALFSAISTTFGVGNGSSTFNLPDLRGRVSLGAGTGTYAESFANTAVTTGTDLITISAAGGKQLLNGMAVVLTTTGTAPTGLTAGNTYYVIAISSTTIKLASSLANAIAGTAIDITGQGTGTHTLTLTLTARTLGDRGGEEAHGLTVAEIPAHTHNINGAVDHPNGSAYPSVTDNNSQPRTPTTGSTGGSGAHNNVQPYLSLNHIIKT